MMETPTLHAIEESVAEVLERMFFSEPFPDGDGAAPGPDAVSASLRFDGGEESGRLTVAVSPGSALRLASDFLGGDQTDAMSVESAGAVVCEMANMICGAVLSRISAAGSFDLSSPAIQPPPYGASGSAALCRSFQLEDGSLQVSMEWTGKHGKGSL
jgi:CheY-specific phosphatase CheX